MLAKYWKKIGIFILIIACIFNIMAKLINKISINTEIKETINYIQEQNSIEDNNKNS